MCPRRKIWSSTTRIQYLFPFVAPILKSIPSSRVLYSLYRREHYPLSLPRRFTRKTNPSPITVLLARNPQDPPGIVHTKHIIKAP
jgi:hypothetical protein